jgi:hypothetical protein
MNLILAKINWLSAVFDPTRPDLTLRSILEV